MEVLRAECVFRVWRIVRLDSTRVVVQQTALVLHALLRTARLASTCADVEGCQAENVLNVFLVVRAGDTSAVVVETPAAHVPIVL